MFQNTKLLIGSSLPSSEKHQLNGSSLSSPENQSRDWSKSSKFRRVHLLIGSLQFFTYVKETFSTYSSQINLGNRAQVHRPSRSRPWQYQRCLRTVTLLLETGWRQCRKAGHGCVHAISLADNGYPPAQFGARSRTRANTSNGVVVFGRVGDKPLVVSSVRGLLRAVFSLHGYLSNALWCKMCVGFFSQLFPITAFDRLPFWNENVIRDEGGGGRRGSC